MFYERVAALLPERILEWLKKEIEYAGLGLKAQRFLGFIVAFGLGLSTATALNASVFLRLPLLPTFLTTFAVFAGLLVFWVNNKAESKGRVVESIIPDALQLIASNIRSGLTTERALFVSAREEFEPLSKELKQTSKRILSGQSIEEALLEIPRKIKSRVLERAMWLISEGIKSGGQIADLLIQLGNDLREENALRQEITANIGMYIMLIFFSAAFGAPLLFGISSYIVGVLSEQTADIGITQEQLSGYSSKSPALRIIGIPQSGITEEFVVFFAQIALLFTCIFASLTLGVIGSGSEKAGIKFLPIILIIAFALFHLTRIIVEQFFGNTALFF